MRVTIIADASHCPDTLAAGYGYWIASERGKFGGGGPMKGLVADSTTAEMQAVCNALYAAVRCQLVQPGDEVLIQTDCEAAIQAFQGSRDVRRKHEREVLRYFHSLRERSSIRVSFRHVKGHTKRKEARYVTNNLCDQRAKEGMRQARATVKGDRDGCSDHW